MPVYDYKDDHRPPKWDKDKKSKWTVKIKEEEEIFFHGYNQNWLHEESESIWAIKVEDESPLVIGADQNIKERMSALIWWLLNLLSTEKIIGMVIL